MDDSIDKQFTTFIKETNKKYKKDLSVYDKAFLLKLTSKRQTALGLAKLSDYMDYLLDNICEATHYFNSLNITYSIFFREALVYDYMQKKIIPDLMGSKADGSEIRIWSAGCASGQEAYSTAIILDELLGAERKHLRYRIFATDIAESSIEKAREGVYEAEEIQNIKHKHLTKYFIENGGSYAVVPSLKKNISFSYYDMLNQSCANPPESIYGNFDIVICCNLLLYYKTDARRFIIKKLKKSLSVNGFFVTGEAERAIVEKELGVQPLSAPLTVFKVV